MRRSRRARRQQRRRPRRRRRAEWQPLPALDAPSSAPRAPASRRLRPRAAVREPTRSPSRAPAAAAPASPARRAAAACSPSQAARAAHSPPSRLRCSSKDRSRARRAGSGREPIPAPQSAVAVRPAAGRDATPPAAAAPPRHRQQRRSGPAAAQPAPVRQRDRRAERRRREARERRIKERQRPPMDGLRRIGRRGQIVAQPGGERHLPAGLRTHRIEQTGARTAAGRRQHPLQRPDLGALRGKRRLGSPQLVARLALRPGELRPAGLGSVGACAGALKHRFGLFDGGIDSGRSGHRRGRARSRLRRWRTHLRCGRQAGAGRHRARRDCGPCAARSASPAAMASPSATSWRSISATLRRGRGDGRLGRRKRLGLAVAGGKQTLPLRRKAAEARRGILGAGAGAGQIGCGLIKPAPCSLTLDIAAPRLRFEIVTVDRSGSAPRHWPRPRPSRRAGRAAAASA